MDTLLTIITPTYNRADCLEDCWKSLCAQTDKRFQWLVVDDGSTDNTGELMRSIMLQSKDFRIDYVKKQNGGKHTALNASHPYIKGDYVVILDSDDTFIPSAVSEILTAWNKYNENKDVGQVIFLKGYSEDKPICYVKNDGIVVDTITEPRISITGRDCCDSYRTGLFINNPFPEFENEKFIGEGAAFFLIELESKGVYINKVIYICNYREDGLTRSGKAMRIRNPLGGMYNSRVLMNKRLPIKYRVKKGILYSCYAHFAKVGFKKALSENDYKILTVATYLPGVILYIYWKKKYN